MNRYTNFILTVIAVALVGILLKDVMIVDAIAAMDQADYKMIKRGIQDIVQAIRSCN